MKHLAAVSLSLMVVGLEMEAAMTATTAHRLGVANWAAAKGVMEYADLRKDDRYKGFAARSHEWAFSQRLARYMNILQCPLPAWACIRFCQPPVPALAAASASWRNRHGADTEAPRPGRPRVLLSGLSRIRPPA